MTRTGARAWHGTRGMGGTWTACVPGWPVSDVAVYLGVSQPAVSNMIPQGKVLAEKWKIDIL